MNAPRIALITMVAMAPAILVRAANVAADTANTKPQPTPVTVSFVAPEKFTDVAETVNDRPGDQNIRVILSGIADCFNSIAQAYVPANHHLTVTVTDVDLAGRMRAVSLRNFDFPNLPAVNARSTADDFVLVGRVYDQWAAPAIKFTYVITDSAGKVARQGNVNLRGDDHGHFEFTPVAWNGGSSGPGLHYNLHYERDLIAEWFVSEFKAAK